MVRILPADHELRIHAFVDRSILEVFAQSGRAAVTARVYPKLDSSDRFGTFNDGPASSSAAIQAWLIRGANMTREAVLSEYLI